MKTRALAAMLIALFTFAGAARAHGPKSARMASEVRRALESRHLTAFAAPCEEAGVFVAASLSDQGDLLVVRARYAPPETILGMLEDNRYQDVVVELLAASVKNSRVFVEDSHADGLWPEPGNSQRPDNAFERSYDGKPVTTVFDGKKDTRRSHGKDYGAAFRETEAEYVRDLQLLLRGVRRLPSR